MGEVSGGSDPNMAAAVAALQASMPVPATSAPPGVGSASVTGIGTGAYARPDHTHQSSVQAQRLFFTFDANGQATWTYPTAYAAGVTPVIELTAETPNGSTYKYDAVLVQGTATNTSCKIQLNKLNNTISIAVLGIGVAVSTPVTTGTQAYVHCWARVPTA